MKTRALLLALPLLALGLGGCRDNAASVSIQTICVPKAGCTFSSSKCESSIVVNPAMNTAVTKHLTLFFQVENQLPNNADEDLFRLNTNDANVEEAEIEYSGALGGKITMGASGLVPAEGTAVVGLDVVPAVIGNPLSATPPAWPLFIQGTANLRLRGHYVDGSSFETAQFPVTVDITSGAPQIAACVGACPQVGQYPSACP